MVTGDVRSTISFPARPLRTTLFAVVLMGVSEIADMLGVSRQQVHKLAQRPDFPPPLAVLRVGKIWRASDIEKWAQTRPQPGRPEKPYPPR